MGRVFPIKEIACEKALWHKGAWFIKLYYDHYD
jgi:hypothetical protein